MSDMEFVTTSAKGVVCPYTVPGEIGCSPSPHLTPSNQLYQPKKETVPLCSYRKRQELFHFCG